MYGSSYGYGTNLIAGGDVASHSGSDDFENSELFSVGEQGEGNQSGSESLGLLLSQSIGAYEGNQSKPENLQINLFQAVQATLSRSSQVEPSAQLTRSGEGNQSGSSQATQVEPVEQVNGEGNFSSRLINIGIPIRVTNASSSVNVVIFGRTLTS